MVAYFFCPSSAVLHILPLLIFEYLLQPFMPALVELIPSFAATRTQAGFDANRNQLFQPSKSVARRRRPRQDQNRSTRYLRFFANAPDVIATWRPDADTVLREVSHTQSQTLLVNQPPKSKLQMCTRSARVLRNHVRPHAPPERYWTLTRPEIERSRAMRIPGQNNTEGQRQATATRTRRRRRGCRRIRRRRRYWPPHLL